MPSYTGKILRVDLSGEKCTIEQNDEIFYRRYMGGAVMGAYYLLNEMTPGTDPFSPDNIIVFASSVLVGAPAPGFCRYSIISKSPLTGRIADTQAGGFWGPELKLSGFDAVVVKGRAKKPCYLWITGGHADIRDASEIWGKTNGETLGYIRNIHNDDGIKVLSIGQAGENLVRYANVVNDLKHYNGRTGMGAVMGSKNLKAIAARGTGEVGLDDPDTVKRYARWFAQNYKDNPCLKKYSEIGTSELVKSLNEVGMLPTRNFTMGYLENAEAIYGETMARTILQKTEGCFACPVRCKRVVKVEGTYDVDPAYGGPEYETIAAFGSNCEVLDLEAVAKANELCAKYGLDSISTGSSIAFAMECYENGILKDDDTDGDLSFGNARAMLNMIQKIAFREGLGAVLAEGTKRASERIGQGSEKFAVQCKGQEMAMHDARVKGMVGFGYMVGPLGGDHVVVEHDPDFDDTAPELYIEQAKSLGLYKRIELLGMSPEKVRQFCYLENHFSFIDSLCLCVFTLAPVRTYKMEHLVELVNAITGWESSLWEIMKLGEKRINMFRAFNAREGCTREEEKLPQRMFTPLANGKLKGVSVSADEMEEMKDLYYRMRNWTAEGVPTEAKLVELELEWVFDALSKTGIYRSELCGDHKEKMRTAGDGRKKELSTQ